MRQDKQKAIQLRKQGKSYKDISDVLGVPKSTLSNWFSEVSWSKETKFYLSEIARKKASERMMIISHNKRNELQQNYQKQRELAQKQFKKFIKEPLFIAGLMIYWGEGDRKLENGMIRVGNSDPLMVKLFYQFIKTYLPNVSSKIRMYLVLYPDLNEVSCKSYWSKKVGVPLDKFFKSSIIEGKHKTKRLGYGVGTLTVNNRLYKETIITWLNLVKTTNISRV